MPPGGSPRFIRRDAITGHPANNGKCDENHPAFSLLRFIHECSNECGHLAHAGMFKNQRDMNDFFAKEIPWLVRAMEELADHELFKSDLRRERWNEGGYFGTFLTLLGFGGAGRVWKSLIRVRCPFWPSIGPSSQF